MIKVKVLGAKQSARNIRRMDKATRKAYYEVLLKVSKEILALSKSKYVPVLTGALKRSGKVKGHPGRYPVVFISFGNAAVPYALMQHENMRFQHPSGGRAKYLEIAANEIAPTVEKKFGTATRTVTKKYSMAGFRPRG